MARAGMASLITELRGLTEAGTADYSIAGSSGTTYYWSDDQLQQIFDINRRDVYFEQLQIFPSQGVGGTLLYNDYRSRFGFFEETTGGTVIFYLQDSTGANVGTTNYTPDYRRGQFTFGTTQAGSVYYATGRSYDMHAAAADVLTRKASHLAPTSFDFSTDNHSIIRSQAYLHCVEMSRYFQGMSADAIQTIPMFRSDVD